MKKITLVAFLALSFSGFAQFTTGVVNLTANRTVKIDTDATTVTLTMTGPSSAWLGIGFGGTGMATAQDVFIWSASPNQDYNAPGGFATPTADAFPDQSWLISNNVVGTTRTIVATRPLATTGDYAFLNNASSIDIIYAQGSSTTLAYHGNNPHAGTTLQRTSLAAQEFALSAASVFPNPSNGSFTITSKSALETVTIYSQTGALIKTIEVTDAKEKSEVAVDNLATGVYLIELKNSTDKSWKKVIVN